MRQRELKSQRRGDERVMGRRRNFDRRRKRGRPCETERETR